MGLLDELGTWAGDVSRIPRGVPTGLPGGMGGASRGIPGTVGRLNKLANRRNRRIGRYLLGGAAMGIGGGAVLHMKRHSDSINRLGNNPTGVYGPANGMYR